MVQKWHKKGPKRPQNGVKTTPTRPQNDAKRMQNDHQVTQNDPESTPKMVVNHPQMTLFWSHLCFWVVALVITCHCKCDPKMARCGSQGLHMGFLLLKSLKNGQNSLFGHLMHSITSLSPVFGIEFEFEVTETTTMVSRYQTTRHDEHAPNSRRVLNSIFKKHLIPKYIIKAKNIFI